MAQKPLYKIGSIVLAWECHACHGTKKNTCFECEGKGMIVTEEGNTLLAFVDHFFGGKP